MVKYDINNPPKQIFLPGFRPEISGLTDVEDGVLALVQDEDGVVFFFDWHKEIVFKEIELGECGEYEGITRVCHSIFVLRSDGLLIEIRNFEHNTAQIIHHKTDIPIKNNEGLGYEADNHRILIAEKSPWKSELSTKKRAVYEFDLNDSTLCETPVYVFDDVQVDSWKRKNLEYPKEYSNNKKEKSIHQLLPYTLFLRIYMFCHTKAR